MRIVNEFAKASYQLETDSFTIHDGLLELESRSEQAPRVFVALGNISVMIFQESVLYIKVADFGYIALYGDQDHQFRCVQAIGLSML